MSSQQKPWQSDSQLAQPLKLSTWTPAQAEQMLQIQRQSGLSVMAFCRRVGIKTTGFILHAISRSGVSLYRLLNGRNRYNFRVCCDFFFQRRLPIP